MYASTLLTFAGYQDPCPPCRLLYLNVYYSRRQHVCSARLLADAWWKVRKQKLRDAIPVEPTKDGHLDYDILLYGQFAIIRHQAP